MAPHTYRPAAATSESHVPNEKQLGRDGGGIKNMTIRLGDADFAGSAAFVIAAQQVN